MKRKFFAVGWVSISNKDYPEPTGKNTTFAIFANEITAQHFAEAHGGCKVRPVEVSLKFTRPTKRAGGRLARSAKSDQSKSKKAPAKAAGSPSRR